MSIYEYDEAAHMSQVREEGVEYGREEGRNEGEWMRLISQIRKKLGKNMQIDQIADMLEEDEKSFYRKALEASSDRINVSQWNAE